MSTASNNAPAPKSHPEALTSEDELISELVDDVAEEAAPVAEAPAAGVAEGDLNLVSDGTSRTTDRVSSGIVPEPAPPAPAPPAAGDKRGGRTGLRVMLVVALVVLVALAAVLGVFAWRYSASPDVTPADTERLAANGSGAAGSTALAPVDATGLPALNNLYGLTYQQAKKKLKGTVAFASALEPSEDERIPALKYLASGAVANAQGETVATVTLGLTKARKVVYACSSYDLDALGVAVVEFQVLANDRTVAASLLAAAGLDAGVVEAAPLSLQEDASAAGSRTATSSTQQCTFVGETGAKGKTVTKTKMVKSKKTGKKVKKKVKVTKQVAFEHWALAEVYDHPVGTDATLRSVVVEFY